MQVVDDVICARHSVRGFERDRPVPAEILREALEVAQRAPSNCNVQPWRLYLASGAACARLRRALKQAIAAGEAPEPDDPIDTFRGDYRRLQVECALALYVAMGITRGDAAARARALRRNYEFFDAPHVAILCMEAGFGVGVALDVGVYLQTLMLALTARGVGTCAQASLRNYPRLIRTTLGIPEGLRILCGLSIGYEDASAAPNRARQRREPVATNVVFLTE